ncbi:YjcZ family sporulation protein [Anaerobacillus sp. MEB173]|uniref:YjcZ family sporulation protein n=1 Tax=Anaerobacillus sp. MEB173 TaxID=3383345 RepID=UPI003F91BFBB
MYSNVNAAPTLGANVPPMPTYTAPAYSYGCPPTKRYDDFILIVVLFILLIIVGVSAFNHTKC